MYIHTKGVNDVSTLLDIKEGLNGILTLLHTYYNRVKSTSLVMSLEYSQPAVLAQYSSVPQLAGSENKTLLFIQTVLKSFNYLEHARVHLYISLCPPVLKVKKNIQKVCHRPRLYNTPR